MLTSRYLQLSESLATPSYFILAAIDYHSAKEVIIYRSVYCAVMIELRLSPRRSDTLRVRWSIVRIPVTDMAIWRARELSSMLGFESENGSFRTVSLAS